MPRSFRRIHGADDTEILFSCEHASQEIPPGWTIPPSDMWLIDTHWAYDLGAAILTEELADRFHAGAVLSAYSRLLVDPNRPEDSDTLFRREAEGRPIELNSDIDEEEQARRLTRLYRPYHDAFDTAVSQTRAPVIFSVHSFTPVYEGSRRPMEVGILFDEEEALAERVASVLGDAGFIVAMNQPYSGKDGLIFAVDQHAHAHGRHAIEVELRQDLAVDASDRSRLIDALFTHRDIFKSG